MRHLVATISLFSIFTLAGAAPIREGANKGWGDYVDPDKDCEFQAEADKLTITVPGTDHDLGAERGKMNAPRALQSVEGDFTIEVKVSGNFAPKDTTNQARRAYHGAGFVIMKDDKTYLRFDRATYWDGNANQDYGNFEVRKNGALDRFGNPADLRLAPAKDTWLKIERKGNTFQAFAAQEKGKWRSLGERTVEMPAELRVGVAVINSSRQVFAPQFSDLKVDVAKQDK